MFKNIAKLVLISFVILFLFNISSPQTTQPDSNIKYVNFGETKIKVELAISDAERELGLSGRKNLFENEGMLFVFEKNGLYPFWMKDMNFPIDIIWISRDKKIVFIEKNAVPDSYPDFLGGGQESSYVLEVPAGTSLKNNLKVGDSVIFNY